MSDSSTQQDSISVGDRLRDRCRSLGLPVYRCAVDGAIIESPIERGVVGLWLRSGLLERLITRTVMSWGGKDPVGPVLLFPGCWLIVMPEARAGRIAAYTLAAALTPESLKSEQFLAACSGAQLDAPATKHALEPIARRANSPIDDLSRVLRWTSTDLDELSDSRQSLGDFTDALTFSYETIDLLYALGRSMSRPERPDVFVRRAIASLHGVLDFAWIGATFVDDDRMLPGVAGASLLEHDPRLDAAELQELMRRLLAGHDDPGAGQIHEDVQGAGRLGGPQVFVMPLLHGGKIIGVMAAGDKVGQDPQVSTFDTGLVEAAASQISPFLETTALYAEQHAMFMGTLAALTSAIDAKDKYTCGHSGRVAFLAAALAQKIGLDGDIVERVHIAGLVHDVGKIGVPEAVLCKAARLTDEEFALIREHPAIGHRILCGIPAFRDVLPGVMHHHERWDGRGYPHALKGDDIPLYARLIGIADTFDAMSSSRSYRDAAPREKVVAEIRRCSGSQFDPRLVGPFLEINLAEYDRMLAGASLPGMVGEPSVPMASLSASASR